MGAFLVWVYGEAHWHLSPLSETQKRILKLMVLVIVPTAWLILSKTPKQSHDLIEVEMGD
jgi:hypothetical protein